MTRRTMNFSDKSLTNPGLTFLNAINVATLGQVNSLLQAAGVVIPMGGQDDLTKRFVISEQDGADWSLAATGTLFGGLYQVVFVDTAATAANIFVGAAAYMLDTATGGGANSGGIGMVVTDSAHALSVNLPVGVFLNPVTPGNFTVIQVGGKATVKYGAAVASTVVGDYIVATSATPGCFNTVAGATALTAALASPWVGNAIQAPAAASLGTILLKVLELRY